MSMQRLLLFLLLPVALAACQPETREPTSFFLEPGSGEPFLWVAPDGSVLLSYLAPENDSTYALRYLRYSPRKQTWSEPQTITTGTDLFVNWADFPSLVQTPSGRLVAHWLVRTHPEKFAYEVQMSYSEDGGQTWAPPFRLHDDSSATEHGFVSLLPVNDTDVLAIWLDGRKFAQGHHEMTLRSRLLLADGWLTPEQVIDTLTCDCCQTALARWQSLPVAFYRDRTPGEIRDIALALYRGSTWETPGYVHQDGWEIPGCPVNGPATDATEKRLWVAWFTAARDTPRVYVSSTAEMPPRFNAPMRVDQGQPIGRVDLVALEDGSAVATWMEAGTSENEAFWMARRVSMTGDRNAPVSLATMTTSRKSGFPRIVRTGDHWVLAWTSLQADGRTRVQVDVRNRLFP